MPRITHDQANHCFILTLDVDGEEVRALLEYKRFDVMIDGQATPMIDFRRTFVPTPFRGKGLAEKLVREGLQWARQENFRISASCWYVDRFLR
ncbi:MAG: N-acetyltransferase [Pseudomonadales bacterium]|nr:N-acetyltransferase [Pseudomonadales bacterium]